MPQKDIFDLDDDGEVKSWERICVWIILASVSAALGMNFL
jgi:hypothetical protein